MSDEAVFRWVMVAGFVAVVGITAPHRVKAGTREKLDRRKEGVFMLATLRPAAGALWLAIIAYMIDPSWMSWSALALPRWLRWSGRHPFYVAMALVIVASTLITANWFVLASGAVVFALLALRSRVEEEQLAARFGDAYREYRKRTGRFLPRL